MLAAPGLLQELARTLSEAGLDLEGFALAWARVAPSVALVPAFGLRALPAPARAGLALALAATIAPALVPLALADRPWPIALLVEAAKGLPIALTASLAIWVATMTGGLVDNLRGAREASGSIIETDASPLGALFGMFCAIAFLSMGGPSRIALLALDPGLEFKSPLLATVTHLTHGVELAVLVAAPVVAASIVLEVFSALIARAASPASIQQLIQPLRSVALLGITALLLERMLVLLTAQGHTLP